MAVKVIHCNSRGEPLGREHFTEDGRLIIPDTPAGRLAFDVFRRLAVNLWEAADEATRDFMLANFPEAQTIRKDYVSRQYRRIIEMGGETYAVIYDFKTKTTAATATEVREAEVGEHLLL